MIYIGSVGAHLTGMIRDLQYAVRVLRQHPGFALVAIISLALGVGANAAMFSFADALLLRPLPVPDSSGIVMLQSLRQGGQVGVLARYDQMSYPDYVDVRDRNRTFAGLTAARYGAFGFTVQKGALPRLQLGELVTGNFFSVLGVRPVLGRGFRPDEDQPGRVEPVVVLGHDLWKREFGSSPNAIGQHVLLNGIDFTIIGIAPETFFGSKTVLRSSLFVPLAVAPILGGDNESVLHQRDSRNLTVRGRLKPNVTVSQADAELGVIGKQLARAYPKTNSDSSFSAASDWQARLRSDPFDGAMLGFLLALAVIVLLIACANVANLMLSRARAREREIAVRLAIGAGRGRLVRQLLTESLVVAVLGGVVGLLLAANTTSLLSQYHVPSAVPVVLDVRLDLRAVLLALTASVVSVLLCGLAPAMQGTRLNLLPALKSQKGNDGQRVRLLGRNTLVIGQVAGALVLLVFATQAYRGATILLSSPIGFRTDHLLVADLDPALARYTPEQAAEFYRRLLERLRMLPGVRSAALADDVPMGVINNGTSRVVLDGFRLPAGSNTIAVASKVVSDGYFRTMGISIVEGRAFDTFDGPKSPLVAVVNELFAHKYFPHQSAVGKRLRLNDAAGPLLQVVGVAKQSKYADILEPPTDCVYLPFWQNQQFGMAVLLYTENSPAALTSPLRETVRSLDAGQPVFGIATMQEFFDERVKRWLHMLVEAITAIALLGFALALVGLYGLLTYSVRLRYRELGIRMALGADPRSVLRMVLRQGIRLATVGIIIGLVVTLVAGKPALSLLQLDGFNLPLLSLVVVALAAAAALGACGPAARASRVDPNVVLREE